MAFSLSQNKFKSAQFIFSKIKRELSSLGAVNRLDEADFAGYTAEVLKQLGCATYKESEILLTVVNGQAELPKDFMYIYAAYKCNKCTDEISQEHYQGGYYVANDITCEVLGSSRDCALDCECPDKVVQKITVRQYVGNDCTRTRQWDNPCLLRLSPNVHGFCSEDSPNLSCNNSDEITINNSCVNVNFTKGDVYLQYYAFAVDEDGIPEIPDVIQVEKAVEWGIKYNILLNSWVDNSIPDIQNKWNKAEQMYEKYMSEAKYINKLPSFQTLITNARRGRKINKVSYFS